MQVSPYCSELAPRSGEHMTHTIRQQPLMLQLPVAPSRIDETPHSLGSPTRCFFQTPASIASDYKSSHATFFPARLKSLGLTPRTRDQAGDSRKFSHVLFAAPPSGSEDYPAEVRAGHRGHVDQGRPASRRREPKQPELYMPRAIPALPRAARHSWVMRVT
jgi:hypothetical protein